jgi:kynurenine formamidase
MRIATFVAAALVAAAPFAVRAESTASLLQAIKHARVIDLSHTWDKDSPIASVNPDYDFALQDTHENTKCKFDFPACQFELTYASEVMHWSGQHGAPSIDAIGHIGRDGKLFGGVDAVASTSHPDGIGASGVGAHLAIDQFPTDLLVNRGVLLDVASMVRGDLTPLPADFEITGKHLEAAAKRQRVELQKGDTVFIRTGWGQHFNSPAIYTGEFSPGPGLDAAEYLIAKGARIVGDDTLTFEKRPPIAFQPTVELFPVHMRLIADKGIYIIENLNLEELAAAKVYEFPVVVPPLKVRGGTGSAVRVFALVPR